MGNETIILNTLGPVFADMAKFGWGKVKEAIDQPETVQAIPPLPKFEAAKMAIPSLPELPSLPSLPRLQAPTADIIPPAQAPQEVPPTVTESYAAEMEDTSVACIPCTRRHISTMATAGQEAAGATDGYKIRKEIATIAAEALVWIHYDLTPDKLAKARPNDRQVIQSIQPDVQRLLSYMPMAPVHMLKAWGATDESRRFARSRQPSEKDQAEIARRVSDMEGWVGYTESTMSGSSDALTLIREARHAVVKQGHDLKTLDYAEEKLREAVVQLTPMPDQETVRRVARDTAAIKDKFYGQVLGNMASRRKTSPAPAGPAFFAAVSPFNDGARWHMDRDTRLPAELRRFLDKRVDTEPGQAAPLEAKTGILPGLPFGGLMGATNQTVTYYQNLLAFAKSQGVTVRERSLPATWQEGILEGAYSPDFNTALQSAAANAEDNHALQTLNHELSHAVEHNPHCLPNPTAAPVYEVEYEDTIEEREADLTNLLVFTELRLPLEMSDGTTLPARQWQVSRERLRQALDPLTYERVTWGADILIQAAKTGSARVGSCPVRLSA